MSDAAVGSRRSPIHVEALVWTALAVAIVAAGFAGFDRWFYEHVSLRLNDESRPTARDFHFVTRPFWEAVRFTLASFFTPVVLCAIGFVLDDRRRRRYIVALVVVAVVALAANVLQGAIGRVRPNQSTSHLTFKPPFAELLTKQDVCFPSGEATLAFAVAAAAAAFFSRWRYLAFGLACLAAAARLINGAHYPSDVAAGALIGAWATVLGLRMGGALTHAATPPPPAARAGG